MADDIKKLLTLDNLAHFKDLLALVAITNSYADLDGKPLWVGTKAEYEAQKDDIPDNTLIGIIEEDGSVVKIVSWADGTDAEIKAMIDAADAGLITLSDYWHIGDKRTVQVGELPSGWDNGNGEGSEAKVNTFTILDDSYGNNDIHFVVGVDSGRYTGYMNYTDTNAGGWRDCARRYWCNNILYNGLESGFKSLLKPFSVLTPESESSLVTTNDYLALISFTEHYGKLSNHGAGVYDIEQNTLTQFKIFSTGIANPATKYMGARYRAPVPNSTSEFYDDLNWKTGHQYGTPASNSEIGNYVVFGCI